ncbi:MAG: acyltransferase [Deltaproteobacteria bacterium]|nr:acyltransferase [Deltaproteobacteria bacterium]
MKKTLRLAAIQITPTADTEQNLSKAGALIEVASNEGARLIALPQLFSSLWFPASIDKRNFSLAEPESGRAVTMLRVLAARYEAVIVAPVFEESGGEYFNTAFVIDADGSIAGKYRKMHVPAIPLWEEKTYFAPGNLGFPVFETRAARIGVQICWDVFFPEGARILALKGAELIIAPTASAFMHSRARWDRAIAASAQANGLFILRVNRVGKEASQEFYGRSFCAGPDGEFVSRPAGAQDGVVMVDIDLNAVIEARSDWTFLKDRRPEEYEELTKKTP